MTEDASSVLFLERHPLQQAQVPAAAPSPAAQPQNVQRVRPPQLRLVDGKIESSIIVHVLMRGAEEPCGSVWFH